MRVLHDLLRIDRLEVPHVVLEERVIDDLVGQYDVVPYQVFCMFNVLIEALFREQIIDLESLTLQDNFNFWSVQPLQFAFEVFKLLSLLINLFPKHV